MVGSFTTYLYTPDDALITKSKEHTLKKINVIRSFQVLMIYLITSSDQNHWVDQMSIYILQSCKT